MVERIHYAGGSLVTGSAIAHSLLAYAQALASRSSSDTVTIPVRHPDGSTGTAEILIGPASQLIAEPFESDEAELEDDAVVARLDAASVGLHGSRAVPEEAVNLSTRAVGDLELPPGDTV